MDINYIVNRAIGQVASQRGWDEYHTEWVDFTLPKAGHEKSSREFQASNEHWFLVSAEESISIQSDRGKYEPKASSGSNEHNHSGQIMVSNSLPIPARAVFIRMVASKKNKGNNGTGNRDTEQ